MHHSITFGRVVSERLPQVFLPRYRVQLFLVGGLSSENDISESHVSTLQSLVKYTALKGLWKKCIVTK